jgi:glycine/D-amino acid oxidase-like deaminating enzyme
MPLPPEDLAPRDDSGMRIGADQKLFKAWRDEGPNPAYHRAMKAKLKKEWPTLYNAVQNFCS